MLFFCSRIFEDKESMLTATLSLASVIASKSPVAVQGTKYSIVYSRDHSVKEGLEHVVSLNSHVVFTRTLH